MIISRRATILTTALRAMVVVLVVMAAMAATPADVQGCETPVCIDCSG
jgi:hypothetical protein